MKQGESHLPHRRSEVSRMVVEHGDPGASFACAQILACHLLSLCFSK